VLIEDEVFIGPHVCFTNDPLPVATHPDGTLTQPGEWKVVPTWVKRRAAIGANATLLCGITIGEGALVGAGSVVTRDVPDHAVVYGSPARVVRYLNSRAADSHT
jgi:acetyltransferase-like isoleucine patch superfamily enzyme